MNWGNRERNEFVIFSASMLLMIPLIIPLHASRELLKFVKRIFE